MAVIAQSHFGLTGAATSIGEQPIKMLVNPKAGARMAVGEALTNIVWARISGLEDIKCSANWMWAPKLPGEGAALYDAVRRDAGSHDRTWALRWMAEKTVFPWRPGSETKS